MEQPTAESVESLGLVEDAVEVFAGLGRSGRGWEVPWRSHALRWDRPPATEPADEVPSASA